MTTKCMNFCISFRFAIISFFIISSSITYAQSNLKITGTSGIKIYTGTSFIIDTMSNSSTGTITCNGTLEIKGNLINQSGSLFNSSSIGTVSFSGTGSQQKITGTSGCEFYGTLDIDNTAGVAITDDETGANQNINGILNFSTGTLTINDFDLTIGTTDPTGSGASTYIVTNGTGKLKRSVPADGTTNILFPVGNSAYNPLILKNSATATTDNYSVIVSDSKPSSFTGTTHIVNRSWSVSEETANGSDLMVTTQWNGAEEAAPFDRTYSTVGVTTDNGANVYWGATGAAVGSNPYTRSTSAIPTVGTFMVGDYYFGGIVVDLQAFLAAAYNATNDNMDLTINSLIPLTDPYGLTTTVSSVPASAVDWVKIELRDKADNTSILYSFARLIDQDGQIIEEDESNINLKGVAMDSYYIAILHRNHFGVISNSTVDLSSSPTLSFKSDQATAWQDGTISSNSAMKEVETNVFGLWEGDVNNDGYIKYNGTSADRSAVLNAVGTSTPGVIISSTYSANDANMDGDIKYNGTGADRISILNVVGTSTPGVIYTGHLPE